MRVLTQLTEFEGLGGSLIIDPYDARIKARYPDEKKEAVAPILARLRQHRDKVVKILRERVNRSNNSAHQCDPYCVRMEAAKKQIATHPFIPGLVRWLQQAKPQLQRKFTISLPREMDRLWDAGAPLDKFQKVLDEWVETHQRAIDAYMVSF